MRKAAGAGCVALIGLGQSVSGWQSPLIGIALVAVGILFGLLFLVSHEFIRTRLPYTVVRRETTAGAPPSLGRSLRGPELSLEERLQAHLRKGRFARGSCSISSDGSSATIEVWEQDLVLLLEDAGRHDLVTRLEARNRADFARGVVSEPWATKARMDRRLVLLSEFVRELSAGGSARTELTEH